METKKLKNDWQPIGTAPKDWIRILLYVPIYGAGSGNWDGKRWHCHFCRDRKAEPTHWMALSGPPEGYY